MSTNTLKFLPNGENTIAVMGGTTMAMVAENMGSLETENVIICLFQPEEGLVKQFLSQANSISAVNGQQNGW